MTPFANATTPTRFALGTALAVGAIGLFLLVASNVLLLGLRHHDGGIHWSEIATGWPRYGTDPRFDRWLTLSTLAGVIVVFGLLGAILRHRPLPLHGSARFASEREIKAAGLRSKEGVLLGRKDGALLCFGGSEHVLIYAPTRAGKGVGYVIPNLLNWPDSVVVLDVKKENWDRSAGFRAAHGQEVHLFDPLDENGRTARYNPLGYVRSDPGDLYDDLQRIAVMLFPAESRGDPFWFEAARSAFVAVGGYVAETPGLPLTIGEILHQLSAAPDLKTHFEKTIAARKSGPSPLSRHCITALNDFLAASENTMNSVRKTVTARLGLWLNPRIDAATSTNDFDLRQLRQRPMSIYLGVTPDNLDRMAPLLNLFFQQVVDLNTRELPEQNSKLNRKVLLLLDEFPALGNVNVLAKSVAFIAGYGIRLLTVVQSPAQLRAIYGMDSARNFMTNHAVEVVFAPKEQDVANEALGEDWLRHGEGAQPQRTKRACDALDQRDGLRASSRPDAAAGTQASPEIQSFHSWHRHSPHHCRQDHLLRRQVLSGAIAAGASPANAQGAFKCTARRRNQGVALRDRRVARGVPSAAHDRRGGGRPLHDSCRCQFRLRGRGCRA
ncbi:type IV secretion system protein VirD4 (plasmid) [Bradyrhizobium guangxiense]